MTTEIKNLSKPTLPIRFTERNPTIDWMMDRASVRRPQLSVPEAHARRIDDMVWEFKQFGRFHSVNWQWPGALELSFYELFHQTEPRRIVADAMVSLHAAVLARSIKTHGDVESDYLISLLIETLDLKPLFKVNVGKDKVHFKSVRPMIRAHGVAIDVTVKRSPAPLLETMERTLKTLVDRDVAHAEHVAARDHVRTETGQFNPLSWKQRAVSFRKRDMPEL
ncbi:hypothetical protein NKH92_03995 [Mesorhizobium sp. M0871]|uniref:hypothetical protein n=1 Tax=Mesorhizobium sp. M0871 TaxID=2957017 RepID=UPI0033393CF7